MAKFRKKPVVIEAIQWDGLNLDEILGFAVTKASILRKDFKTATGSIIKGGTLIIETAEGEHAAAPGDWIIKGVAGEFYPCKPDIFTSTYEVAE